jgi:HD domain
MPGVLERRASEGADASTEQPLLFSFLSGLPRARSALAYAFELHLGQRRASDDASFILHPLEVAALLHHTGHREEVVVAAILHDTVENTRAARADIAQRFGEPVAGLVAALTEDPRIQPYEARKAALRQQVSDHGPDAIAIDTADKLARIRELRIEAQRDLSVLDADDASTGPRLEHYASSLAMVERSLPEHPLVRQLRFEIEALRALPPRAGRPARQDTQADAA